jgi:hypothetical protein
MSRLHLGGTCMSNHSPLSTVFTLLLLALVVLAGCGPTGNEIAGLPTVAVLPTDAPSPTATTIPSDTPTPTVTPTFTPSPTFTPIPTRRPTQTPIPTDITADCAASLFGALESTVNVCIGTESGFGCNGSGNLDAEPQPNYEESGILRIRGSRDPLEDVRQLSTPLDPQNGIYGIGTGYLNGDLDGFFPSGQRVGMVVLGGTTVRNGVDHPELQQAYRSQNPTIERPLLAAFTRMEVSAAPLPEGCEFIPTGLLLQATRPASIELNGMIMEFTGTVHVGGEGVLEITNLEGNLVFTRFDRAESVLPGITARVPLNDDARPIAGNIVRNAIDPNLALGLFERAAPVFNVLGREVAPPDTLAPGEVALFNTFAGEYRMETDVTFLSGLYTEGEPINANLRDEVIARCGWPGAWELGTDSVFFFTIEERVGDASTLNVAGAYPGTQFPLVFIRQDEPGDVFSTIIGGVDPNTRQFIHTLRFVNETTVEWTLDVTSPDAGICNQARIRGVGTRGPLEVAPTPPPNVTTFATWDLGIAATSGFVPPNEVLPDCPTTPGFTAPATVGLVGTATNTGDGTLRLQGEVNGLPTPEELSTSALRPGVYSGALFEGTTLYTHEIEFIDDGLRWRVMITDTAAACRLGTLDIRGERLS